MRVGIDVRSLQGQSGNRGIGRFVGDLIDALFEFETGFQFVFFGDPQQSKPVRLQRHESRVAWVEIAGPGLHDQPLPLSMRIPRIRTLAVVHDRHHQGILAAMGRALSESVAASKVDVMHLASPLENLHTSLGRIDCHTVASFMDAIPLVFPEIYLQAWDPLSRRHYEEQLANLKTRNRIGCLSDSSRQDAIRFAGTDPAKTHTVYCAAPPGFRRMEPGPTRDSLLAELGVDRPFFLFCSAFDHHKNLTALLDAFVQLRRHDLALVCVTSKDGVEQNALVRRAWDQGLSQQQLKLTGRVSDDQLAALYSAAIAAVTPSLYEGFGLPAAEAMQSGTPVISSNRSSLPEVVGDAALLVDPEQPTEIAEAMQRVMDDPSLAASMVERGYAQVAKFTPERLARGYAALYRDTAPS